MNSVSDYSLIALLPVILVGLLITTIFCVYRFRRWKHNKKQVRITVVVSCIYIPNFQLAELNAFYEIVESSPCLASGKPYLIQHCKDVEVLIFWYFKEVGGRLSQKSYKTANFNKIFQLLR